MGVINYFRVSKSYPCACEDEQNRKKKKSEAISRRECTCLRKSLKNRIKWKAAYVVPLAIVYALTNGSDALNVSSLGRLLQVR